jgi:hypothetical protein
MCRRPAPSATFSQCMRHKCGCARGSCPHLTRDVSLDAIVGGVPSSLDHDAHDRGMPDTTATPTCCANGSTAPKVPEPALMADHSSSRSWTYVPDIADALGHIGICAPRVVPSTCTPDPARDAQAIARIGAAPEPRLQTLPGWSFKALGVFVPFVREWRRSATSSNSRL